MIFLNKKISSYSWNVPVKSGEQCLYKVKMLCNNCEVCSQKIFSMVEKCDSRLSMGWSAAVKSVEN